MEQFYFNLSLVPFVIILMWYYTSYMCASFPLPRGKRILLLIAHPDDEAMFFAPTVLGLSRPELGNQLKILCMSSGNAEGLGEKRKDELRKSAQILGLSPSDVVILDDPNFPDNQGLTWPPALLSRTLLPLLAPSLPKTPASSPATATVDILITFDPEGVSGHPNHAACALGAEAFVRALTHGRPGWQSPVALYALRSIALPRKYAGVLDLAVSVVQVVWDVLLGSGREYRRLRGKEESPSAGETFGGRRVMGKKKKKEEDVTGGQGAGNSPSPLLFVNSPLEWLRAQRAMWKAHRSQMVWFRWGWIGVGRYMIANDLRKVKV